LPDPAGLNTGDILNRANKHVVIFEQFVDEAGEVIRVYESSRSSGKVHQKVLKLSTLIGRGFVPFRYRRIAD